MNAMVRELNIMLSRSRDDILSRVKLETRLYLYSTPTYKSLIKGDLRKEFGFYQGSETMMVKPIIDELVSQIFLEYIPLKFTGSKYETTFKLKIFEKDLKKILGIPQSEIITEKGYVLPWLEWLLIEGNAVIVFDYNVAFTNKGRSGGAIMVKGGGSWKVPDKFSGTKSDNWITRSIQDIDNYHKLLSKIIEEELVKAIP